jgi:hypothetical protein
MTTTTIDGAGTISVPMSSILDALEGVLTEEERLALFTQLINLRPAGVAPGDLITAELFNQVMSDINDLMARMAALEAAVDPVAKTPVITQILPQIVRTGDDFQVIGRNLTPGLLSRIEVEDTPIPLDRIKAGSGPTKLVLEAPALLSLPNSGATVILTVFNAAGSDQGTYFQLPGIADALQALITIQPESITPDVEIVAGDTYTLSYEIAIQSSADEEFRVVPHIDPGWTAVVQGSDMISAAMMAEVTATKTLAVTAGSGSAELVLELVGTNFPAFSHSGSPLAFAVGSEVTLPSNQIQIESTTVDGPHAFAGNVVQVWNEGPQHAGGETVTLNVQVRLKLEGTYNIENLTAEPTADWGVVGPPSTFADQDNKSVLLAFTITPKKQSGGLFTSAPGTISFNIVSDDDPAATTPFSAQLQVVSV